MIDWAYVMTSRESAWEKSSDQTFAEKDMSKLPFRLIAGCNQPLEEQRIWCQKHRCFEAVVSDSAEETVSDMMEVFAYDLIREMRDHLQGDTMLMLCPKTTFALLGTEKAVLKDVPLSGPMKFGPACLELLGKVRVGGMVSMVDNINRVLDRVGLYLL